MLPTNKLTTSIGTMDDRQIEIAESAEKFITRLDKLTCITQHTIHAGIYTRTMFIPKGSMVAGVIIKIPTTVILSGKMALYTGNDVAHIDGYNVMTTEPHRKQVAFAIEDSYATMMFQTTATTVEEAEKEMSDECDRLQSREEGSINIVNITEVIS